MWTSKAHTPGRCMHAATTLTWLCFLEVNTSRCKSMILPHVPGAATPCPAATFSCGLYNFCMASWVISGPLPQAAAVASLLKVRGPSDRVLWRCYSSQLRISHSRGIQASVVANLPCDRTCPS